MLFECTVFWGQATLESHYLGKTQVLLVYVMRAMVSAPVWLWYSVTVRCQRPEAEEHLVMMKQMIRQLAEMWVKRSNPCESRVHAATRRRMKQLIFESVGNEFFFCKKHLNPYMNGRD